MKKILFALLVISILSLNICVMNVNAALPAPPSTWQEHWFEHNQMVNLVYYNDDVAIYLDNDINSANAAWINTYATNLWRYVKQTYGSMGGDGRLYVILHNKYPGGHPSYYYDSSHDYRNTIDIGGSDFSSQTGWNLDVITHEVGHIVESVTYGTRNSPSFGIWGDSKWCEIFIYDVYNGLGMTSDAQRIYNDFMDNTDSFPRAGTAWFKNWFYPIWSSYGRSTVLNKYFLLLSQYYPKYSDGSYTRGLNMGEFVYFWSGASGVDLKSLATNAFGWTTDYENQYNQAKNEFPSVMNKTYFMIVNKNSGKCLDLIGGDPNNGARINQWAYDYNSANQRWAILPTGDGHFKIISYVSGKSMSVVYGSMENEAQIHDWDYLGNPDQKWDFIDAGNGWYKIRNVNSGKMLDVAWASLDNDAKVQQNNDNGHPAEQWRLQPWGDYNIKTTYGKYVCVENMGSTNGSRIIQYSYENNPWFKWRFENVGDGWYKVSSLNAITRCIDVKDVSTTPAEICHLWDYVGGGNQKVRILPKTNGTFQFFFQHDGMAWDIPSGQTGNNVPLTQYPYNGWPNQEFVLERVP